MTSWTRFVANELRALAHRLDPIPLSPELPLVGSPLEILIRHPNGACTRYLGVVNVVQYEIGSPAVAYLALNEDRP